MKLAIHGNELVISGLALSSSEKQFFINLQTINDALKRNGQLTSLNLSGNNLGDTEIKFLLPMLADHTQITSINLSNNNIGSNGALAINDFLEKINESWTSIDLSSNQLSPQDLYLLHKTSAKKGLKIQLDDNPGAHEGLIGPLVVALIKTEEITTNSSHTLMRSLGQFFSAVNDSVAGVLSRNSPSQEVLSSADLAAQTDKTPQNTSDLPLRELPSGFKVYGTF